MGATGFAVVPEGVRRHGDYWFVKNSRGTNWRERSHIRVARRNGNLCGIATFNKQPAASPDTEAGCQATADSSVVFD